MQQAGQEMSGGSDPGVFLWFYRSSVRSHKENAGHLVSSPIVIFFFSELEQSKHENIETKCFEPSVPKTFYHQPMGPSRNDQPTRPTASVPVPSVPVATSGDAFASVVGVWNLLWSAAPDVGLHPADPTRPGAAMAGMKHVETYLPYASICSISIFTMICHDLPWFAMICLRDFVQMLVNICKYSSTMEHMGHHDHQEDVEWCANCVTQPLSSASTLKRTMIPSCQTDCSSLIGLQYLSNFLGLR